IPLPTEAIAARRDTMLALLAEQYVGTGFADVTSGIFALLLLSAASTAITGMLGISFAMARDGELPRRLGRLNRFGVPTWSLIVAVLVPSVILVIFQDVDALADLYAIGVVGAIALNAFATGTSKR